MKLETISISISILALILSGFVFWFDFLRPFNPKIYTAGRIGIITDPYNVDQNKIAFKLPLIFDNIGAKVGYIEDVALAIKNPKNETVIFRSLTEFIDETINATKNLEPPKMQAFNGFSINKKESKNRTIFFQQFNIEENFELIDGDYTVVLFYKTSRSKKWIEFKERELTFTINIDDIESLNNKQVTNYEDGTYFVEMIERNKPFSYSTDAINDLKRQLK